MADVVPQMWIHAPLEARVRQSLERLARAPGVQQIAVMPDVHLASGVSNGVVVATERLIYPAAVGGDIGCGFATVAFDGRCTALRVRTAERVLHKLGHAVPVIRHRRRDGLPVLDDTVAPERLSATPLIANAAREGPLELGTLGRGNHFLELQQDEKGRMWLMVHSGSRALGQQITAFHRQRSTAAGGGLAWLDAETSKGRAYLHDLAWARAYARTSRQKMLTAAADVLTEVLGATPDWSTLLDTDHNHVQREEHGDRMLWVHRKGANIAADGVPNVIPGSMATQTLHVIGRGAPEALRSSSHGAGRRLPRGVARSRIRRRHLERQLGGVFVDPHLRARLVDEAPAAYKDIDQVMRAQRQLVRIVRRVRPVLCYKGV